MSLHLAQTIEDLLADPLIQTVMQADRVDAATLRVVLTSAATRVAAGRRQPALALNNARVRFGVEACTPQAPTGLRPDPRRPSAGCEARFCG